MDHYQMPTRLASCVRDFLTDRQILMTFDGQEESRVLFKSGLPQGSPLSPVLHIHYASGLGNQTEPKHEGITVYVDDELMIQGSASQKFNQRRLQECINLRAARAPHLNIRFAHDKTEFMHVLPRTANSTGKRYNNDPITVHDVPIAPSQSIRSFGVTIDHRLTFKAQATRTSARLRGGTGRLWAIAKRKGASPGRLHQILTTENIPGFIWVSEAWWTSARHVMDQLTPSYHALARIISGLPKWCPLPLLLQEAALAPLDLLLDQMSPCYEIRLLLRPDYHQCKQTLLTLLRRKEDRDGDVGLRRIATMIRRLIPEATTLECKRHVSKNLYLRAPDIRSDDKRTVATSFNEWAAGLDNTILLFTDESK